MIYRLFFLLLSCLSFFVAEAKIIETPHVADAIALVDQDTWVLVDLDNTLFEAKQALGHTDWYYEELQQRLKQGMSYEEAVADAYILWIRVQPLCPVQPLEEDFVPSLISLQNQGVVVMGFTLRQPSVAKTTVDQVASLGLDFTKTSPAEGAFTVPAESLAIYLEGILFASDYNTKGGVFLSFLDKIGKTPQKVLFIDDKKSNIEELEQLLPGLGIQYIGVHYTAHDHVKPIYDRKLAEVQYKFLDKILSNEAASLLIEQNLH